MFISRDTMKTVIFAFCFVVVVFGIVICVMFMFSGMPMSAIVCESVPLVDTVRDHDLPKTRHAYRHSGKPEFVATKILNDEESKNLDFCCTWFKIVDKEKESQKPWWEKFKDCLVSLVRILAFDEGGTLIFTKRKYQEQDVLSPGEYVYISAIRVEADFKLAGTYIWEFPIYMEKEMCWDSCMDEKSLVKMIQDSMKSSVDTAESYKVEQTERGAIVTHNFVKLRVELKFR